MEGYRYVFKVLVVGDADVGKTSLLRRSTDWVSRDNFQYGFGTSFALQGLQTGQLSANLIIWNVADETRFGKVRPTFYKGGSGVIYVFSVTDQASFENIPQWAEEVHGFTGKIPALVVGNKIDLTQERLITNEEGRALAEALRASYIETSAISGPYLINAIQSLTLAILQPKLPEISIDQLIVPSPLTQLNFGTRRVERVRVQPKKPPIVLSEWPLFPPEEEER